MLKIFVEEKETIFMALPSPGRRVSGSFPRFLEEAYIIYSREQYNT